MKLRLRPHHGLCISLFDPMGHSEPYIQIMDEIIHFLSENPNSEIEILSSRPGLICEYCPHNHNGLCGKRDEVDKSDSECLCLCEVENGQRMLWSDYRQRLTDMILSTGKLQHVCAGCDYLVQCETINQQNYKL